MYWRRILRNILANWFNYVVTILIGFTLTPFVISKLGNTGYGVWTLVLSLTGYFGVLDLGIRSSVGRFVARYIALNEERNVNRMISSAFVMLAGGGLLALIATAVLYLTFGRAFTVGSDLESVARTTLVIVGLNVAFAFPMGVFTSLLIAMERFDVITGVTIAGSLTRATLIVLALTHGSGVVALALITLIVGMAEYGAMSVWAKILYRPLKISVASADKIAIKELLTFSSYRFVWIMANQLIFYTSSVVIGLFMTAGDITHYAVAVSIINYGRHIVALVSDTFAPSATRLHALNDLSGLQNLLIAATKVGLLVTLPVCIGFIFLGEQFITLWLGKDFAFSAILLVVLTIPQFTSLSQYVSVQVLTGMAKHKVLAFIALGEGLANLVISVILIQRMGLMGVALGSVFSGVVSTAILIPWYTLHTLRLTVRHYWLASCMRPLISAIPAAAIAYACKAWFKNPSWLVFSVEVCAVSGALALTACFVCFDAEQRMLAVEKAREFLQRRRVPCET